MSGRAMTDAEYARLDKQGIAYEEAGHAVARVCLGLGVDFVTIDPDESLRAEEIHGGAVVTTPTPLADAWRVKREILCCLVGPVALVRFLGDRIAPEVHAARWSPGGDYHAAACYATRIVGLDTRACVDYVGVRIDHAVRLTARWWPRIVAVATALVAERTLSGARVRELARAA